ncbi:MAG: hypothetical protein EXS59_02295 [Candidatus Taylorbacteria bacterium]|nr:hypothetical protein [Candidatus Taylorbacteria bacterium]
MNSTSYDVAKYLGLDKDGHGKKLIDIYVKDGKVSLPPALLQGIKQSVYGGGDVQNGTKSMSVKTGWAVCILIDDIITMALCLAGNEEAAKAALRLGFQTINNSRFPDHRSDGDDFPCVCTMVKGFCSDAHQLGFLDVRDYIAGNTYCPGMNGYVPSSYISPRDMTNPSEEQIKLRLSKDFAIAMSRMKESWYPAH